ncbi:MAG: tetratricopeptide repeat protein [Lentisphaeraceae bacterium]|nr:tetratricopeptide repeat protein [Lentisphaeraceae bacterium]
MKLLLLTLLLFTFGNLTAQDDIFDLEKGAQKKPKKVITLEELTGSLQSGDYKRVHSGIEELVKAEKDVIQKPEFQKIKLKYQLETGQYKEALEFIKSSKLTDDFTIYQHCLVLIKTGAYDEAQKIAEAQIAEKPQNHLFTFILFKVAELTGNKDLDNKVWSSVKKMYFKSKSGREGDAYNNGLLGLCIRMRSPQKAYIMFQRAYKKAPKETDIYVWAGKHCSEKYEWNYALEELTKGLKVNSNHAEAKAALANVLMEKGDYQKARELVAEALEVNPNSSEALQLMSQIYLVDDQKRESKRVLEHGLESNPKDLKILSLLAASYHQETQFEKRDELIKKILEINPKYSKVYLAIAQSCEDLRQFPEAVEWASKAIENNSRDWEGYFISGMNLLRLGEETEGYKILDRAFALNGFNIWARNILVLLDRDFKKKEFVQFETEHFVIKLHRSESNIMYPYLKDVVEEAYEKYTKKYGIEPVGPKEYDGKILLLMFDRHNDFSARTVGLPGLGALGACFGQIITMPSPIIGKGNDQMKFHWKRVFEHEFVHVLTLQKSSYYVPRWLTEGISTWEEEDPQSEVDRQLQWAWKNGRLLPIEDINSGFSQQSYPNQIGVSYYHASLICKYVNDKYGFEALTKMLELFKEGKSNEVAVTEAIGKSLSEINKEVKVYLDAYISQIPLTTPLQDHEIVELESKNNSFGLPVDKQLDLAAAYIRQGKRDESRKLVDKILKTNPKMTRALNMSAMLYFHAEDKEKAKADFGKVLSLEPNHYVSNYFMAMMVEEDETKWEEAVNFYKAALRQYPRVESPQNNIYYKIVNLYDKHEQPEKALETLIEHSKNNNKNFDGWVKLGDKLLTFEKKEEAAKAFLEANYIYPFEFDVHIKLGDTLIDLKRYEEAIREFEVAVEMEPRNKNALLKLHKSYLTQKEDVKAEDVMKRLKRFYPDDSFDVESK